MVSITARFLAYGFILISLCACARMLQVLVQEFGLKVDISFIMSLTTLLEAFSVKMPSVSPFKLFLHTCSLLHGLYAFSYICFHLHFKIVITVMCHIL